MNSHILLLSFGFSFVIPIFSLRFFPSLTREILRDLRIPRILHYVALSSLGLALYARNEPNLLSFFYSQKSFIFILFIISLVYAAVFAIVSNNIEDLETDKISNPDRPLVQGKVEVKAYFAAGMICQIFALLLALAVQIELFWGILAISVGYYLYSCQPFRLKRFPFLAKLLIGFNSLSVSVCGFVLAGGKIQDFPLIWAFFILIPLSLSANFVDLKDIEGDKVMGVKTLPVLWGEEKAKNFIAICTIFNYGMGGILLNINWVYPLVAILGALHLYFLYRKPYDEKPVFLIYVTALFGLTVFLFF